MTTTETNARTTRGERLLLAGLVLLCIQSAYLAARADATMFYGANVFLHAGGGLAFAIGLLGWTAGLRRRSGVRARLAGMLGGLTLCISAGFAIALALVGNLNSTRWMLTVHGITAVVGALLLLAHVLARATVLGSPARGRALALVVTLLVATGLVLVFAPEGERDSDRIVNPELPPLTMADEAMGGAAGPFFPSSITTNTEGKIPSDFFFGSDGCGRSGCHPDITEDWRSSMHRFASFNNQFYRKSIEYMQEVVGVQPSKWCAGCHDVALLLDGKFDRPVEENIDLPEAHVGLACVACHSITQVKGSMGQGGYEIEYPPLHRLATSENPLLRGAHDLLLRLDPEPHARAFLKPFHREQASEFCSSCHKVHLDVPVNDYRWIRGFNDYDSWQASGVSGQGARAFYYPEAPMDCVDCHMPLVASDDKGNRNGLVHAHHFAAANTAVPTANKDLIQLERVEQFLKDKVTVDVFALVRAPEPQGDAAPKGASPATEPMLSSTFAVGEEGGFAVGSGTLLGGPLEVVAPIDRAGDAAAVRRGESARVDVVVRTRAVGHFFPGGTVDAFDVWVELHAEDENGRPIFWSGAVEDDGKGPVEPGAHFYRALMLDEHGNAIDKRNAWAARSVLYVRLVPPGAADVARYRIHVPDDCGDEIRLTARLNYRKFAHFYTQFAYAGRHVDDPAAVSASYDDRELRFDADLSKVSGELKEIPDLPTIVISTASATLRVLPRDAELPEREGDGPGEARGRWNDYGIGLLLQGDLRGALDAFDTVVRLDPSYADGFVNQARVRLREGDTRAALVALDQARTLTPGLAREQFFRGLALKSEGRLDEALAELRAARAQHPRDRVVLNEIARTHFLKREFPAALDAGREALSVDPEDVTAHYTMMLAARGAGDLERSAVHEALYLRFKADDDAPILTGEYRRQNAHDNRERQPIHEHGSVPLPWGASAGQ